MYLYLAFPQFSARLLLSRLAPAFADGQTEAIANFKDSRSGCLEWYRQCILSRCPPSQGRLVLVGRRPRQRVHTKSRTRPTLQRQRVYRRRPAVRTKCTSPMRLMAILFYAWRLGARQKSFAREPDYLLPADVCQLCQDRRPVRDVAISPSRCGKTWNSA